jgi:hypothetical protein
MIRQYFWGIAAGILFYMPVYGELNMSKNVLFHADFESNELPNDWWIEGGEKVWVEDGRLYIKADPPEKNGNGYVCTVWNKTAIAGDVQVDFDAHVISSTLEANNINFFLFYADPTGKPLYETRETRTDGGYKHYHHLNGYIFTFLNAGRQTEGDERARIRMRRCPGFELLTETYDYHCRQGVTYHVTITRKGGQLTFAVDGKVYLKQEDPEPWRKGLFGLRTFHTDLWWDNIQIMEIAE